MDKESCWADKTPLETGLILILIVATPLLITLILVYILMPILCADCSIACSTVCNSSSNRLIFPQPSFIDDRSIKLETEMDVCPYKRQLEILKDVNFNIDHAFIASIIEDIYEDDSTRQRYLCAAAIVTFNWVVTGSICFGSEKNLKHKNKIFVRAGSNRWSSGGSVHEVKQILFSTNTSLFATVAAVKLHNAFPRQSLDLTEMYDWKTNDSMLLPLKFRKKYVILTKQQLTVLPDSQCNLYTKKEELFCVTPVAEKLCSNYSYSSFPVTKANILLGINFGKICDTVNNITVYLIFDTTPVLSWLQIIVQS